MSSARRSTSPVPPFVPVLALALLPAFGALTACGAASPRTSVERTDSAGIEVVTSGADDAPLDWSTHTRLVLGGADEGPESFFRVTPASVAADDAGRIYVLDHQNHRVVAFGPDGGFIREVGGQGGGPGELQGPAALGVAPDGSLSVFDFGKGALVRWSATGDPLPELTFPHYPMADGRHYALLTEGYLVSTGGLDEAGERANRLLRVVGEDTTVLASVAQPNADAPAMFESCRGGVNFPPLFTPHVVWDHSDGMTAVAAEDAYRIDLYHGDELVRSIRRSIPPQSATREEAIAEAGDGFRIDFGQGPCLVPPDEYAEARGWAATVPAIADLAFRPGGELWVQRRVPGEEHPPIDVFNADGSYRATLPPGTPFPVVHLPDGAIGSVVTDAMDVQRLEVRELARRSYTEAIGP